MNVLWTYKEFITKTELQSYFEVTHKKKNELESIRIYCVVQYFICQQCERPCRPPFRGEKIYDSEWLDLKEPPTWLDVIPSLYLVIRILLPRLDLLNDVVAEVLFDPEMKIAEPVGLHQDALPRRLGRAVLGSLLDLVVPILRPVFKRLGIVLLDLRPFLDQSYQTITELVTVLDSPRRSFVVARLPEGVRRRYQHVVVAVMWHLSLSREIPFTWKSKGSETVRETAILFGKQRENTLLSCVI